MPEAAPLPVFWLGDESSFHGIPMDVTQLLDELALAPHIKVIVPRLPERLFGTQRQPTRDCLLNGLESPREHSLFRFAHKQVHMFRHYDIAGDEETVLTAGLLQRPLEETPAGRCAELRLAAITTEGDVMQISGLLEPFQSPRHDEESTALQLNFVTQNPALAELGTGHPREFGLAIVLS